MDDPHFYRADNLEKATANIPDEAFSILLSYAPEIYRQAAHVVFDLMLSGHTHGGQTCLPGQVPITLDGFVTGPHAKAKPIGTPLALWLGSPLISGSDRGWHTRRAFQTEPRLRCIEGGHATGR